MDEAARQATIQNNAHILRQDIAEAARGVPLDQLTDGVAIAGGEDAFHAILDLRRRVRETTDKNESRALTEEIKQRTQDAAERSVDGQD